MNQSGRMEKVREALTWMLNSARDKHDAALAEVEEWERCMAEVLAAYDASVDDQTRLKAAEAERDLLQRALNSMDSHAVRLMGDAVAEADRLKAALEAIAAVAHDGSSGDMRWAQEVAHAALAPADRDTA